MRLRQNRHNEQILPNWTQSITNYSARGRIFCTTITFLFDEHNQKA